jgi:hypothetical protein
LIIGQTHRRKHTLVLVQGAVGFNREAVGGQLDQPVARRQADFPLKIAVRRFADLRCVDLDVVVRSPSLDEGCLGASQALASSETEAGP